MTKRARDKNASRCICLTHLGRRISDRDILIHETTSQKRPSFIQHRFIRDRRFWREGTRWKGHAKQERKIKEEKKSSFSSFFSLLPLTSVCLARARARATTLGPFLSRWIVIRVQRDYTPPNADGNCTGISRVHFSIADASIARIRRGPIRVRCDSMYNGCPRYDIYFIDISLPSSMIIYNCCPRAPDCNYYNYRFFVRALSESGPGPGPDVLFVPSLSMQLHPFGPSSLGVSCPFPFICFSLILSVCL